MVIALAGRRIDPQNAQPPRFPVSKIGLVRNRLAEIFRQLRGTALVCSAACGADLIALEIARELGIRTRVLLPFSREQFSEFSVTDRPGDWELLYGHILDLAEASGDLVVLAGTVQNAAAYRNVSLAILDEAARISRERGEIAGAVVVWEGLGRPEEDVTRHFLER